MFRRKEVDFGDDYVHGLIEVKEQVYDCCCRHHHLCPSASTNDGDEASGLLSENERKKKNQPILKQKRVL
jgi:hypothetical protein